MAHSDTIIRWKTSTCCTPNCQRHHPHTTTRAQPSHSHSNRCVLHHESGAVAPWEKHQNRAVVFAAAAVVIVVFPILCYLSFPRGPHIPHTRRGLLGVVGHTILSIARALATERRACTLDTTHTIYIYIYIHFGSGGCECIHCLLHACMLHARSRRRRRRASALLALVCMRVSVCM